MVFPDLTLDSSTLYKSYYGSLYFILHSYIKDVVIKGFTPSHFCVFLVLLFYTSAFSISYNLLIPLKRINYQENKLLKKKDEDEREREREEFMLYSIFIINFFYNFNFVLEFLNLFSV